METFPKITIITPVYNAGATLERTIQSIIAQNYPNLEYIIMDSCSTDNTAEIIARYPSVITRYICEKDKGPPDAQNKGVALATGDFIQFVYGDDEILPGLLHKVADIIINQPELRVITCGSLMINDNHGKPFVQARYATSQALEISLQNALLGHVHSQFFHRSLFAEFGPLITHIGNDFCYSNDRRFLTKLVFAGIKTAIIPEALYIFHVHSGSLSGGGGNTEKVLRQLDDFSRELYAAHASDKQYLPIICKSIAKNETGLMLLYLRQYNTEKAITALKEALKYSAFDTFFYIGDYFSRHLIRFLKRKLS